MGIMEIMLCVALATLIVEYAYLIRLLSSLMVRAKERFGPLTTIGDLLRYIMKGIPGEKEPELEKIRKSARMVFTALAVTVAVTFAIIFMLGSVQ